MWSFYDIPGSNIHIIDDTVLQFEKKKKKTEKKYEETATIDV